MDLKHLYKTHCDEWGIKFQESNSILSYDETTLFCPAGMQQFKKQFKDETFKGTVANIQPCLRLNDLDNLGDGTHFAYFNMIGLFSFRHHSLPWAVNFWWEFILGKLQLRVDKVTIHPDKINDPLWRMEHDRHFAEIIQDEECKWTDGEIGGYCTEFYVNHNGQDVEIGNIVNPLGTCIDVGFGFERLDNIINNRPIKSKVELLQECILKIIDSGIVPSNKGQGYVLRKLLRDFFKLGGWMEHKYFTEEFIRQDNLKLKYNTLKGKHLDKSKEWWYDTHGVDLNLI